MRPSLLHSGCAGAATAAALFAVQFTPWRRITLTPTAVDPAASRSVAIAATPLPIAAAVAGAARPPPLPIPRMTAGATRPDTGIGQTSAPTTVPPAAEYPVPSFYSTLDYIHSASRHQQSRASR
eukprot:gene11196-biopygen480